MLAVACFFATLLAALLRFLFAMLRLITALRNEDMYEPFFLTSR